LISTAVFAQEAPAHEKMEKRGKVARWEGSVVRSDPAIHIDGSEG